MRLFTITGEIGSESFNHVDVPVYIKANKTWADTAPGSIPGNQFLPQKDVTNGIGSIPDARLANVVYRDGFLWTAQTVYLPLENPTRCAVQWWQISPGFTNIVQFGRVDDPSGIDYYALPSIGVNRFKDVLIGYSSFSTNQYPSANYSFRPFYLEHNKLLGSRIFKAGENVFFVSTRWGDYSATVVDPANDIDLWTIQEFASDSPSSGLSWGTQWAKVALAVPTNDQFSGAITLSGSFGTTNGSNLRASVEGSEPEHGGYSDTPSVWFNWTAPTNGPATLLVTTTANYGITFSSILAVYTGSAVGNLTLVTNAHGGSFESRVVFEAAAATTYRITVAGYQNTMGQFSLSWSQPSAPEFVRHPQSTNVVAGESVTLQSLAIGNPAPSYQWLSNGVSIADATNADYTLPNPQPTEATNQFYFSVMASNTVGSAMSQTALLVVHDEATARITNSVLNGAQQFVMHVHGVTNRPYAVETTTNLNVTIQWSSVFTNYVSFNYTNFLTSNDVARFYRVLALPVE